MGLPTPCYLAEWYQSEVIEKPLERTAAALDDSATSISAQGSPVRLLTMLAVPTDEVIFGIFTAGSAALVTQTCDGAGIPAQRLTAATDLQFPPHS